MIDLLGSLIHLFAEVLRFSRSHVMLYSLPTNPISGMIYLSFAYYGYRKLKTRVNFDTSKWYKKLMVFVYSGCLLSCINFLFENVWLSSFMVKYHFFNNGWLEQIYFNVPTGWFVNYLRNFVYFFVLYMIAHDILKYVNFNKHTVIASICLSLYLVGMFFLTPYYGYIDWTYAIMNNYPEWEIVTGFMISLCGKPLLFYVFYSVWIPKKKQILKGCNSLTLDVGCGSRPQGNVNVDRLVEGSDPLKNNLLRNNNPVVDVFVSNFIVADAGYLPFQDKVFDKTYCHHLMEHIPKDLEVYEELKRVTSEEIEIRVPFGLWEDLFNKIFWYKHLASWRKKHHVRSYSKRSFKRSLLNKFDDFTISYGYTSFLKGIQFELLRKTRFPFPFPYELVAYINLGGI